MSTHKQLPIDSTTMSSTTNTNTASLCIMCDKPGTMSCSGCRQMQYCSKTCQKAEWPVHKLLCRTFKDFSEDQRSSPNHFRAILFLKYEAKPRFVWATFDSSTGYPLVPKHPDLPPIVPVEDAFIIKFADNDVLNRDIPKVVRIWGTVWNGLDDLPVPTPSTSNRSVRAIDAELAEIVTGSLIAVGVLFDDVVPLRSLDVSPLEFRHVVDNLRSIHRMRQAYVELHPTGPTVKGIRWDCHADDVTRPTTFRPREFFSVDVPVSSIPATTEVASFISTAIGVPLIIQKVAPSLAWRDRAQLGSKACKISSFGVAMNPLHDDIGMLELGSVIVMRKDGRPLLREHLRAISGYGMLKRANSFDLTLDELPGLAASCDKVDFMGMYNSHLGVLSPDGRKCIWEGLPTPYEV